MSNPELAKYYLGLPTAHGKITLPTPDNIFACLDTYANGNWSWEIISENLVMDSTMVCTTVMLYVPGRVLTGRSTCSVKDIQMNHLRALVDATKMLISDGTQKAQAFVPPVTNPVPKIENPSPIQPNTFQNMTVNQIQDVLNVLNNNGQQAQSSQNSDSEFPFYFGPEDPNAPPEVKAQYAAQQAAKQSQTTTQPQENKQYPPDYDIPQERYKGFSQHQMDRMADFKKRAEVIDDSVLRNYIHTWNPNFYHKGHLTPQNIDEFFDWYDRLEQTRC